MPAAAITVVAILTVDPEWGSESHLIYLLAYLLMGRSVDGLKR